VTLVRSRKFRLRGDCEDLVAGFHFEAVSGIPSFSTRMRRISAKVCSIAASSRACKGLLEISSRRAWIASSTLKSCFRSRCFGMSSLISSNNLRQNMPHKIRQDTSLFKWKAGWLETVSEFTFDISNLRVGRLPCYGNKGTQGCHRLPGIQAFAARNNLETYLQ
jgi:hypothetical protein